MMGDVIKNLSKIFLFVVDPWILLPAKHSGTLSQKYEVLIRFLATAVLIIWGIAYLVFHICFDQNKTNVIVWRTFRFSLFLFLTFSGLVSISNKVSVKVVKGLLFISAVAAGYLQGWQMSLGYPSRSKWILIIPFCLLVPFTRSAFLISIILGCLLFSTYNFWSVVETFNFVMSDYILYCVCSIICALFWYLWGKNQELIIEKDLLTKEILESEYNAIKIREKNSQKKSNLAIQLSHDIRSPLAVLEMISGSLNELPEEKRLIIKNSINRIRDISNSLLNKNRDLNTLTTDLASIQITTAELNQSEITITLLSPLIDSIITEKRLQYRNHIGIRIDFSQTKESYGLFAKIQSNELQRVLSNLIDNSVEAFNDQKGTIDVFLQTNNSNQIELIIKDNGKGISENILSRLGARGETHGKENGSGLGLFHAKETIKSFDGSLKIDSKENNGAVITITIPLQTSPAWFVPKITLNLNQTLVVFDDDQSIHQIWKGRLESLSNHRTINLLHFSDPNELRKFYRKNFTDLDTPLFLMDFEISGTSESGLDLIETLGIQTQSILVTSRYEEKNIRERCESLGVQLIPKSMSGFVPMEIST